MDRRNQNFLAAQEKKKNLLQLALLVSYELSTVEFLICLECKLYFSVVFKTSHIKTCEKFADTFND